MLTPVILAGGDGSHLWPLSRQSYPKQFLPLTGEASLLQETLKRLAPLEHSAPLLIGNEAHRFLIAEQVRQQGINDARILLEPEGRNTAPSIALAAQQSLVEDPEALLLVLEADHLIQDVQAFQASVLKAEKLAKQG